MNWLKQVIGESAEMPDDTAPVAAPEAASAGSAVDTDLGLDAGAGGLDSAGSPVPSIVQTLVSSWRSGNKIDVASRLLGEPISYADYARLMFAIGEGEAVKLGHILDELSEGEPAEQSEERVMEPLDVRAALQGDEQ